MANARKPLRSYCGRNVVIMNMATSIIFQKTAKSTDAMSGMGLYMKFDVNTDHTSTRHISTCFI